MNNFELHERAQELADTHTPYQLAKVLIKAVESEVALPDNGCGNDIDFERNLNRKLGK